MKFDVSELNTLAADLGKAPATVIKRATTVIKKTAYDIERDGKAFAPVDTGNLRSSISTTARGLVAEIGPTAEYAVFVEEGTSVHAPQAFMGPALDRNTPAFVSAMEKITDDLL